MRWPARSTNTWLHGDTQVSWRLFLTQFQVYLLRFFSCWSCFLIESQAPSLGVLVSKTFSFDYFTIYIIFLSCPLLPLLAMSPETLLALLACHLIYSGLIAPSCLPEFPVSMSLSCFTSASLYSLLYATIPNFHTLKIHFWIFRSFLFFIS